MISIRVVLVYSKARVIRSPSITAYNADSYVVITQLNAMYPSHRRLKAFFEALRPTSLRLLLPPLPSPTTSSSS